MLMFQSIVKECLKYKPVKACILLSLSQVCRAALETLCKDRTTSVTFQSQRMPVSSPSTFTISSNIHGSLAYCRYRHLQIVDFCTVLYKCNNET